MSSGIGLDKNSIIKVKKDHYNLDLQEEREVSTALEDWGRVCGAMELLNFGEEEQDAFWIILAVITNLGYVTHCLGKFIHLVLQ